MLTWFQTKQNKQTNKQKHNNAKFKDIGIHVYNELATQGASYHYHW